MCQKMLGCPLSGTTERTIRPWRILAPIGAGPWCRKKKTPAQGGRRMMAKAPPGERPGGYRV
jgi:hypothetical protein